MSDNICPFCNGEGFIYTTDEAGYQFIRPCVCELARRQKNRLIRSGLTNIEDYTLERFLDTEQWQHKIKELAIAYLQEPGSPWFFIGGQPGCGKTHICTAICLNLIEGGEAVRYEVWASMAGRLKTERNTEDFERDMHTLQQTQTLYIDDFFRGWVSDSDRSIAWELINGRYMAKKRTVISSELYANEIRKIDEAIASRIYQMAGQYILPVKREEGRNQRYMK